MPEEPDRGWQVNLPSYDSIMRTIEARRELARMVERNRNSFENMDYRKRRQAALKGLSNRVTSAAT